MLGAVTTEELLRGWLGFVFLEEESCGDIGPVSVNVFTFFVFQRIKAGSALNSRVKVKTN